MSYDLESNVSQITNDSNNDEYSNDSNNNEINNKNKTIDYNKIIKKEMEDAKKLGSYVSVTKIMKKIDDEIVKKTNSNVVIIDRHNEDYYNDVLLVFNVLFSTHGKSILNLKINSLCLSKEIFAMYNGIIKKHKLECPLFDLNKYDVATMTDKNYNIEILKVIANNLLKPLDYNLTVKKQKVLGEEKIRVLIKDNQT